MMALTSGPRAVIADRPVRATATRMIFSAVSTGASRSQGESLPPGSGVQALAVDPLGPDREVVHLPALQSGAVVGQQPSFGGGPAVAAEHVQDRSQHEARVGRHVRAVLPIVGEDSGPAG